jgi:signal transduction histidine kinase
MTRQNSNAVDAECRAIQPAIGHLDKVSHDFRSPLNIIIGFSELLLDENPGKINEDQKSCLKDILNAAYRLLGLVNETFNAASPLDKRSKID